MILYFSFFFIRTTITEEQEGKISSILNKITCFLANYIFYNLEFHSKPYNFRIPDNSKYFNIYLLFNKTLY
jgi:hypothetical protein